MELAARFSKPCSRGPTSGLPCREEANPAEGTGGDEFPVAEEADHPAVARDGDVLPVVSDPQGGALEENQ